MAVNKMDTDGKWMVDSDHIYVPSTPCKVEHSNVTASSTGRDETGVMHIEWLRRDVRKVFLHYNLITSEELAYMMGKMQGKEFSFKFFDQGAVQTIDAYVGEATYSFYTYNSIFPNGIYKDFEIHVIEK